MRNVMDRNSGIRGAALILEIIIYLVIVALIAVAVTSGVRAIRDLTFASHARGDAQVAAQWMEGKYSQDNVYPGSATPTYMNNADLRTTQVGSAEPNQIWVTSINGPASGYCILVNAINMSDKGKFWLVSSNPSHIYQKGTGTNGGSHSRPDTGIAGLTCAS